MPQPKQFVFDHKELLEVMIKECGVHEGEWMLLLNLGFSGGNFGPEEGEVLPGGLVVVKAVGISRVEDGQAPPNLVLDASVVNPPT